MWKLNFFRPIYLAIVYSEVRFWPGFYVSHRCQGTVSAQFLCLLCFYFWVGVILVPGLYRENDYLFNFFYRMNFLDMLGIQEEITIELDRSLTPPPVADHPLGPALAASQQVAAVLSRDPGILD